MNVREAERVAKLKEFEIDVTEAEPEYDRLARLASHITENPVSWICFHDETTQWMKAVDGADLPTSIDRRKALCSRVIDRAAPLQIHDLDADMSEAASLLKSEYDARSYAGAPIIAGGFAIGVVGTMDWQSKSVDAQRERMLCDVADLVLTELRLRKFEKMRSRLAAGRKAQPSANKAGEFHKHFTRDRLRVLQAIKDPIVAVSRAGTISFINPAAEKILMRPAETVIGRPFETIRHRPEAIPADCLLRRSIADGHERIVRNQQLVRGDGTAFPVEIICSPFHVGNQMIGTMLICRDASQGLDIQGLSLQMALKEIERLKQQMARASELQPIALPPLDRGYAQSNPKSLRNQQFIDMLSHINAAEIEQIMRAMSLSGNVLEGPLGAAAMLHMPVAALREKLAAMEMAGRPKRISRIDRWNA